jgi:hypothetical protein
VTVVQKEFLIEQVQVGETEIAVMTVTVHTDKQKNFYTLLDQELPNADWPMI